ncbi:hypothetical protein QBC43DRAFT_311311 [Cladorrhinum sp. PSN259]|nr:hypothetical protein QBC43DRAFT_311311 [Cladorrhinum sp. PSN259]
MWLAHLSLLNMHREMERCGPVFLWWIVYFLFFWGFEDWSKRASEQSERAASTRQKGILWILFLFFFISCMDRFSPREGGMD